MCTVQTIVISFSSSFLTAASFPPGRQVYISAYILAKVHLWLTWITIELTDQGEQVREKDYIKIYVRQLGSSPSTSLPMQTHTKNTPLPLLLHSLKCMVHYLMDTKKFRTIYLIKSYIAEWTCKQT